MRPAFITCPNLKNRRTVEVLVDKVINKVIPEKIAIEIAKTQWEESGGSNKYKDSLNHMWAIALAKRLQAEV